MPIQETAPEATNGGDQGDNQEGGRGSARPDKSARVWPAPTEESTRSSRVGARPNESARAWPAHSGGPSEVTSLALAPRTPAVSSTAMSERQRDEREVREN